MEGVFHTGNEWLVDASGCRSAALADGVLLAKLFAAIVVDLDLRPAADAVWKVFPGAAGVTGLLLLEESHLTVHTFPERGYAAFNLYCCRPRAAWDWAAKLGTWLGATDVTVRSLARVGRATEDADEHLEPAREAHADAVVGRHRPEIDA